MVKPVQFPAYTLKSQIVLDGIWALRNVLDIDNSKIGFVAGGMAVQSYLPSYLHRYTIDLDFSSSWQGNFTDFKGIMDETKIKLNDIGYSTSFSKNDKTFELIYQNPDTRDSFMIQHPRRSKKYFDKWKKTMYREIEHANDINIGGLEFGVMSPEDLIVSKINRFMTFSDFYKLSLPKRDSLWYLEKKSRDLRNDVISRRGDVSPRSIARIRMLNDWYDIISLLRYPDIDEIYLEEVICDWNKMSSSQERVKKLIEKASKGSL